MKEIQSKLDAVTARMREAADRNGETEDTIVDKDEAEKGKEGKD